MRITQSDVDYNTRVSPTNLNKISTSRSLTKLKSRLGCSDEHNAISLHLPLVENVINIISK